MPFTITTFGSPRSGYDAKVRGIISQVKHYDCSLETLKSSIQGDIAGIHRANTAVASTIYKVRIEDGPPTHLVIVRDSFSERSQSSTEKKIAEIRPA